MAIVSLSAFAAGEGKADWKTMQTVLKRIKAPEFKNKDYVITDFYTNGDSLYTDAIQKAIDKCSSEGGGRVIVPNGSFTTGPLRMKSNVNLHLADNAILKFSTDPGIYPTVLTRIEGIDCYNVSPLIYAYEAENIAITGKGILDGQADDTNWLSWERRKIQKSSTGEVGEKTLLVEMKTMRTPIEQRRFEGWKGMRPQFVNFYKCKNILIEDVTLNRSPFWLLHPLMSENITVHRVKMDSHGHNNDGCDPESCTDVLIDSCYFNTGDDCIAIKSGKDEDGRVWMIPSKNIIVRNCTMNDGHAGCAIGSEITGGCENVWVTDCKMGSPNLDRIIRIKSNPQRGGVVKNIFVRNIDVDVCRLAILGIEMKYWKTETGDYPPSFSNIHLDNIHSHGSKYVLHTDGIPGKYWTNGIYFSNGTFENVASEDVNQIEGTANVKFKNCTANGKTIKL